MAAAASQCKIDFTSLISSQTVLNDFIDCEVNKYAPKGAAYVGAVMQQASQMGEQLLVNAQTDVSKDLGRVERDIAAIEHYLTAFIQQAMEALEEDIPKLEKMAEGMLQQGLRELSAWIDKETDALIHSLAPLLAWIVAILLAYQLYGGVFDTLPVAYRVAIATLLVISVPPKWRSRSDRFAAPISIGLFIWLLWRHYRGGGNKKK